MFYDYKDAMVDYLPWYDKENQIIVNVCRCLELAFRDLDKNYDFIYSNLFLDTAVEMVPLFIKKLGLKVSDEASIDDKRGLIQAYMHYLHQQTTEKIVAEMVEGTLNGENKVEILKNIEQDVYDIYMKVSLLNKQNLDMVEKLLRKILPAHLDFILSLLIENKIILVESTKTYLNPFYMTGSSLYKTGQVYDYQHRGVKMVERVGLGDGGQVKVSRYRQAGEGQAGKR